jgi:hypothetical protein
MIAGEPAHPRQGTETVTLAEVIEALRTLRMEMADLRMLIRAARAADEDTGKLPRDSR